MVKIKNKLTKGLFITNLVSLILLFTLLFAFEVPQKIMSKIFRSKNAPLLPFQDYKSNPFYNARLSVFSLSDKKKFTIVMFGNSLSYSVDWNEVFARCDIANRGIIGDITDGYINRLNDIYQLNPNVCFLMGGINDIMKEIPLDKIIKNFNTILDNLKEHQIETVIQSAIYVSKKKKNWQKINTQVDELNKSLKQLATEKNLTYVDINSKLSNNLALEEKYTYDGIHLMGGAYAEWKDLIKPIINKY